MNGLNKEVLSNILDYKIKNIEEYFFMFGEYLEAYLKSMFKFGYNSAVTADAYNAFNEFLNIQGMETQYLDFIKRNLKNIDEAQALDYIDQMDELKENVLNYYTTVFEDITTAAEINRPFSATRTKERGKFINDDDTLEKDIVSSTYTFEDIVNYLDCTYLDEIKNHVTFYDNRILDEIEPKLTLLHNGDYLLNLPYIVDYKTLMSNINLIRRAYYYHVFGSLEGYDVNKLHVDEFVLKRI